MKLIQTGQRVQQDVISKTGTQAVRSSTQSLLDSANRLNSVVGSKADDEFESRFNIAAKEAEQAAGLDAQEAVNSGYTFDEKNEATIYAQQYNKTAEAVAFNNIDATITAKSKELSTIFYNDAQGYQDALKTHVDEFAVENNLSPVQKQALNQKVVQENKKYMGGIMARSVIEQKNAESVAVLNNIDTKRNTALQLIRDGQHEAGAELMVEVEELQSHAVSNNNISPADAAKSSLNTIKQADYEFAVGEVDRFVSLMMSDPTFTIEEQAQYFEGGSVKIDDWRNRANESGIYSPQEVDKIYNELNSKLVDTNNALFKQYDDNSKAQYADQYVGAVGKLDEHNKDEVKINDTYFDSQMKALGKDSIVNISDPETRKLGFDVLDKTGVIPTEFESSMRKTLKSADPLTVMSGVEALMKITYNYPQAAKQLNDDEVMFGVMVMENIERNMSVSESIVQARLDMRYDPDRDKLALLNATSEGTVKAFNEKAAKSFDSFSENSFVEEGILGYAASFFSDAEDTSAAKIDYSRSLMSHLKRTGDYETAEKMAAIDISRKYGVTHVGGESRVAKYSVEKIMNGDNSKSEWIDESWANTQTKTKAFLEKNGVDVKEEDITYFAGYETATGQKTWQLWYKDSAGNLRRVSQSPTEGFWTPDFSETEQGKAEAEEKEGYGEALRIRTEESKRVRDEVNKKLFLNKEAVNKDETLSRGGFDINNPDVSNRRF